jgi:diguanylate cyclase (GGDEF)-like protein
MQKNTSLRRRIGLLALTGILATVVWLVGGVVLWLMLGQQSKLENDAQHIYDVSSAKVFEATRIIRGLERLAREGDSLACITDSEQRKERRQRLESVLQDAALQGDSDTRALVSRSFTTLDQTLAVAAASPGAGVCAQATALWAPIKQDLLNKSEAVGAEVADLATTEADQILQTTSDARIMLFAVAGALALASLTLFGVLYFAVARPVVRLSKSLFQARNGQAIADGSEFIRELQLLHDAAVALGGAHQELQTARSKLEHLAHTDALTGLANRRMFELHSGQAFVHARRYQEAVSVVVFDIDHFKHINDRYGHDGGDVVLRDLGHYLQNAVRDADRPIARMGGEEFALFLTHAPAQVAHQTAERLRKGIEALEVSMPSGELIQFTASLGVAQGSDHDTDLAALLRRADQALYQAKRNGRNRVEMAD